MRTVSSRLDTVEKHHAAVQSRVAAMEKHYAAVQGRVDTVEKRCAALVTEDKRLLGTSFQIEKDVDALKDAIRRMARTLVEVEHALNRTRRACWLKPVYLSFPPRRKVVASDSRRG